MRNTLIATFVLYFVCAYAAMHTVIIVPARVASGEWTYPQLDGMAALYTFTTNVAKEPNLGVGGPYTNELTIWGATWQTNSYPGSTTTGSLLFDKAASNYLYAPYHAWLAPTSALTLSAWVQWNGAATGQRTLHSRQYFRYEMFFTTAGKLQCHLNNGTDAGYEIYDSAITTSSNEWHFIAMSYAPTNVLLVADGSSKNLQKTTVMTNDVLYSFTFGKRSLTDSLYFNGSATDIEFWTNALSLPELDALRGGTNPVSVPILRVSCAAERPLREPNEIAVASDLNIHELTTAESTWNTNGWRTFDGTAMKMSALTTNGIIAPKGEVNCWINLAITNNTSQTIWSCADEAGTAYSAFFYVGGDKLTFAHYSNSILNGVVSTVKLLSNTWYNVGVAADGAAWQFTLDGTNTATAAAWGTTNVGLWTAEIGVAMDNCTLGVLKRSTEANFFKGTLDQVAYLTNATWTADQRLEIFNQTRTGKK